MKQEMDKLILTDCDGVLLNWDYAFHAWMKTKGYKQTGDGVFDYDMGKRYNMDRFEIYPLIEEFNSSAAIAFLPPLRDSIYYIKKLHEQHGYVFHCITSLSADKSAQKLRIMNLEKLFGNTVFEDYTFLPCGSDKRDILKEKYGNSGLLWLEDKLENAIDGEEVGLEPLLMEHGHNMIRTNLNIDPVAVAEAHHIPRFENWKQIYAYITGE